MEENIKLSDQERLSYIIQLTILEKLDPEDSTIKNLRVALEQGYELHYSDLLDTFLLSDGLTKDQCRLVLDILEMYRGIIFSAYHMNLDLPPYKFPGFDGNDDLEVKMLLYTKYFIGDLGRYDEIRKLNGLDFNSHCLMLPQYKRMLNYWKQIPMDKRYSMSMEEINHLIHEC